MVDPGISLIQPKGPLVSNTSNLRKVSLCFKRHEGDKKGGSQTCYKRGEVGGISDKKGSSERHLLQCLQGNAQGTTEGVVASNSSTQDKESLGSPGPEERTEPKALSPGPIPNQLDGLKQDEVDLGQSGMLQNEVPRLVLSEEGRCIEKHLQTTHPSRNVFLSHSGVPNLHLQRVARLPPSQRGNEVEGLLSNPIAGKEDNRDDGRRNSHASSPSTSATTQQIGELVGFKYNEVSTRGSKGTSKGASTSNQ